MLDFSTPLSGLNSSTFHQNVSANNLANATTPGFQYSRAHQVDAVGGGSRIAGTQRSGGAGPLEITGRVFDLAVRDGDGFFQVRTPQGPRFTRDGTFRLDGRGNLVTATGAFVEPGIQVPADARAFNVTAQGAVLALMPDGSVQQVGQLQLSRFRNPGGLLDQGDDLFAESAASGPAISGAPGQGVFGTLLAGARTASNVDLAVELTGQIVNRTVFRANLSVIRTKDEMLGDLIDLTG